MPYNSPAMDALNSIAVLPLLNLSSEGENEYFSAGITEEIIDALCRFRNLRVTSRTSSFVYKNQNIDIREIGKHLNVNYVLEGSVRRWGDRVRVTAQLIKADEGFHVWSEKWDREITGIFALQEEIAGLIARKIGSGISPVDAQAEKNTENIQALEHYLKGLHMLNSFDDYNYKQMIAHFEEAIALDPSFEKAWVGLCNSYTWLSSTGVILPAEGHRKIQEGISVLMKLNSDIPDIYSLIAGKLFWIEWDLKGALENIDHAISLKPSFADALVMKGIVMMALGRVEEAFQVLFHAERLNPFDAVTTFGIGFLYQLTGDNKKALVCFEKNIQIIDQWLGHYITYVETLCQMGEHEKAHEVMSARENKPEFAPMKPYADAIYYATQGKEEQTFVEIAKIEKLIAESPESMAPFIYYVCKVFLAIGEKEKALYYLEMAFRYRSTPFLFSLIDCSWDSLRNEPRFQKVINGFIFFQQELSSGKYQRSGTMSTAIAADLEKKIGKIMLEQKPYLNPRLSSPELAAIAGISPNQLSQLLNEHIGRNFYDYINSFRLKEFEQLAPNPKYAHLSILGLAYECGFNSKSTFNTFFKREKGTTPSKFFKRNITE